jgi:hypothetical protein
MENITIGEGQFVNGTLTHGGWFRFYPPGTVPYLYRFPDQFFDGTKSSTGEERGFTAHAFG